MKFYTADLHFHHHNIIAACNRPFTSVEQMDKQLISNWNTQVKSEDEVWVLGDFTLLGPNQAESIRIILSKLKGQKHLVLGNHDELKPFKYVDIGFTSVHTTIKVDDFILTHDPAVTCVDRKAQWLCGHVHDLFITQQNVLNVGVDVWSYRPISEEEIKEFLKKDELSELDNIIDHLPI